MKFISLFAGVGGFDLALERLGHECVYANDIDKYCKIIYDKNFCINRTKNGESQNDKTANDETRQRLESKTGENISSENRQYGKYSNINTRKRTVSLDNRSITNVPTDEIPNHNLLVGGFPCQSFSIAGRRGGFTDTRGTLFFDIARIVKAKRPQYLLLENVKGLLSHNEGRTFKTILSTITELDYDVQTMVLNSKNFGVPQNRERVFIVGHLRGTTRPKIFPIGENENPLITKGGEQISSTIVSRTLTATDSKMHLDGNYIKQMNNPTHSNNRIYDKKGLSPTLNTMQGGNRQPKIAIETKIRRLTPVECERLQGFPDGWTEGVSDTQRYKQMGNAVTVNVVYEIAKCFT